MKQIILGDSHQSTFYPWAVRDLKSPRSISCISLLTTSLHCRKSPGASFLSGSYPREVQSDLRGLSKVFRLNRSNMWFRFQCEDYVTDDLLHSPSLIHCDAHR